MKDVLQSISPYYYYLIAEGLKPMEIRKSRPTSSDWSGVVQVYCTKDKKSFTRIPKEYQEKYKSHMGKVGFRYKCDLIEKIRTPYKYTKNPKMPESICLKSRLSSQELMKYIGLGGMGYGWHVSNIMMYDQPRTLYEFYHRCEKMPCEGCKHLKYQQVNSNEYDYDCEYLNGRIPLSRSPQSWCYVERI